jgi:hypothetical protein
MSALVERTRDLQFLAERPDAEAQAHRLVVTLCDDGPSVHANLM